MKRQKKQANKQVKKKTKEIGRACKEHTNKDSQIRANKACLTYERENKHVIKKKRVSYEKKCRFRSIVHSSIGLEYRRHTNSCMNMQASVQRYKEAKKAKRVAQSKQGKHVNVAWSGERCASRTLTPWRCISQVVTSKQALEGTDVTTQASGPKYQQAQAYRRHKACQSLDLDRQTWIYSIEASKQTYTCIKEMIQTL